MSGTPRWCEGAQLALMDAMVFFAVCGVICGTLMANVVTRSQDIKEDALGPSGADELLMAFLRSSVGRAFALEDIGAEVSGHELFSEVLFLAAAMTLEGEYEDSLEGLMSYCGEVLEALCEPWSPVLRLSSESDGSWETLVEVGGPLVEKVDTWAASQSLGEHEGAGLLVTLLLLPAPALHGTSV